MKSILVSLTSWHPDKRQYLTQVLDTYAVEYADCKVTVVLSTAYPFTYDKLPIMRLPRAYSGWDFTWNNRAYLLEHGASFDYIIDSDDDCQIPRAAFDYYVANEDLPQTYIPGFLSCETDLQGNKHLITLGDKLHKRVTDTKTLQGKEFITPYILHSCCMVADKARFVLAVSKGLSAAPTKADFYTNAEYARTEIYALLTKVVSVEAIASGGALVNHLPNKVISYGNPLVAGFGWKFPTPAEFTQRGNTITAPIAVEAQKPKVARQTSTPAPSLIVTPSPSKASQGACCGGGATFKASPVQIVLNGVKAAGRVAHAISSNAQVLLSKEDQTTRLAICHGCSHFTGSKCELCGCYANLKSRLATEHCPIEKW